MSELIKVVTSNVLVVAPHIAGHPPIPGVAGTPGDPGSPGHPPFCQQEFLYKEEIYSVVLAGPDAYGFYTVYILPTGQYRNVYGERCYPAEDPRPGTPGTLGTPDIPGTESQEQRVVVVKDRHIGWTGSAISITQFSATANVKLTFRTQGVGVVCGLNDADVGYAYPEIDYAFYTNGGAYSIFENGVAKLVGAPYVDHDPCFAIIRNAGQVSYHVWVTDHWSRVYTSLVRSVAPIFVDASIYMGEDLIG